MPFRPRTKPRWPEELVIDAIRLFPEKNLTDIGRMSGWRPQAVSALNAIHKILSPDEIEVLRKHKRNLETFKTDQNLWRAYEMIMATKMTAKRIAAECGVTYPAIIGFARSLGVETKKRFPSGPPKSRQRINSFTNAEKSEILSSEPVKRVIQSFACSEYARMLNERPADFSTWLLSRASEELDYYNPQRGVSIPKFLAFRLKKICIEEMRSRFGRTGKKRIFRHETPGESPGINSLQKPLSTLPPYLTTPDLMRALLKANRNLTPGEREAVELYLEHGNFVDAGIARAMKRGKSRKSLIVPQYVSW